MSPRRDVEAAASSSSSSTPLPPISVECSLSFPYPYNDPVGMNSATVTMPTTAIERVIERVRVPGAGRQRNPYTKPIAVAIGPYHRGSPQLQDMEQAKRAALDEFRRVASEPLEVVRGKILEVSESARRCYADDCKLQLISTDDFADMMLLDGCFLLQFMASMCPADRDAPPEADPLMSRAEVHSRVDSIARDVLLLENQIPWLVLEALIKFVPPVPVDSFLALMASAFDVGHSPAALGVVGGAEAVDYHDQPPHHLLGLFHRRQVGAARTQSHRVPTLSSLSTTAVELAKMGVKLTASKTRGFGDMSMSKRRRGLAGLFGELSLAPLVVNDLTTCWLLNMAAYEACLGAAKADNFAISSYVSLVALLMNREEDVQELRSKGIVNSAFSDMATLECFKWNARQVRVGHRYYHIFQRLHEYRHERWVWIAVHSFFYTNLKTIVAMLSIVGVLAGLFKTILSLKQPQR